MFKLLSVEDLAKERGTAVSENLVKAALPSYLRPPLIEVVCGAVFKSLPAMRIPHVGLFWNLIRNQYPTCQHADPLDPAPENFDSATGLPLPRIWLIGESGNNLVQIQGDRLFFNWRKINETDEYPHHRVVLASFRKIFGEFQSFLSEHQLGTIELSRCELTYINHVFQGEHWKSLAEISNVLPDLCWRQTKRFLPLPSDLGWNTGFALPDGKGRLVINLKQATRRTDKAPLAVLELTARGLGAEKTVEAAWEWFSVAHEWIVRGFADITASEIQRNLWNLEEASS